MEFLYLVAALVTAGVSLASGLTSLSSGSFKKRELPGLIFGIMSLCLFVCVLVPSVGFPRDDRAVFIWQLDTKAFSYFSSYALFPWFIMFYGDQRKKLNPLVINVLITIACIVTVVTQRNNLVATNLLLSSNLACGFYVTLAELRIERKNKTQSLLLIMRLYAIFFFLSLASQLIGQYLEKIASIMPLLPFNFFPILFIVIIVIRTGIEIIEKLRLEKTLGQREIDWNALMQNLKFM